MREVNKILISINSKGYLEIIETDETEEGMFII